MIALQEDLNELDASGLIRLVGQEINPEYQFRHVLTQEAAYASLLKQDRRRLHARVGTALEQEFTGRLDEIAPILARHFDEAEDEARALDYYLRAADAAAARFANAEASMHYRRALALAQRRQAPSDERLIDVYLKHGRVLEISGNYAEALAAYVEMEMQAHERDDSRMLLAALMARATIHAAPTVLNDAQAGDELAQRALALALEMNDRAAEAKAWWLRLMAHRFTEHDAAIEYGERSVQIARELNLREQLAYALNDIFTSYLMTAQGAKALAALSEAEQIWRELDNPNLLADALTSSGEILYFMGRFDEGVTKLNESLQISVRTGNAWGQSYAHWMFGEVAFDRADYPAAIAAFHESMRLGAQAGFAISQIATRSYLAILYAELGAYEMGEREAGKSIEMALTLNPEWQGLGHAILAWCHFQSGRRDEAQRSLTRAMQHSSYYDMSIFAVEIVKSEINLANGNPAAVTADMAEAIRLDYKHGLIVFEPHLRYYSGVALLKLGRVEEAAAQLDEALALMDRLGLRRQLWRVQLARAACAGRLGDIVAERDLQAAAGAEVDAVANTLPPNLRETFLLRVAEVKRGL